MSRSMVELFSAGCSTRKNSKFELIFQQLKWRQRFQGCDRYELELSDGKVLTVHQIANGEMKGLGTGTQVWPAAHVLVKFLERKYRVNDGLRGMKVCDIGSGTGVTGLAAAAMGARVVLTDQVQLLPFLEGIVESACLAGVVKASDVSVMRYDWGENASELPQPFDVVLVSDCVLPKLYPIDILVKAVSDVMAAHTLAYFSYEHRTYPQYDPRQEFRRLAALHGLEVQAVPLCEHDPLFCAEDIEIWEVRRSSSGSYDETLITNNGEMGKGPDGAT